MITDILLCIAIFMSIWSTVLIAAKSCYKEHISCWLFIIMAISSTSIITKLIGIW